MLKINFPKKDNVQGKYPFMQNHPLYKTHQVTLYFSAENSHLSGDHIVAITTISCLLVECPQNGHLDNC